jgi:hypothetical protein
VRAARAPAGSAAGCHAGRADRLLSQNTMPMNTKKISVVTDTTFVAKPSVGVKASTEVSRTTP